MGFTGFIFFILSAFILLTYSFSGTYSMPKNTKIKIQRQKYIQEKKKKQRRKQIVVLILLCVFAVTALPYGCLVFLGHHAEKKAAIAYQSRSCSGAVVSFGSYPQTQVTDKEVLSGLNALTLKWKYYKDCTAGEGYYGTMRQTKSMKYADVMYNGSRYRAVMIEQYRPSSVLDAGVTQTSDQDDNGYSLNTVYWFRFEPIRWYVFDETNGMMLSEKVLDAMPFTDSFYWIDRNFSGGTDYQNEFSSLKYLYLPANLWKTSTVRHWLNHSFVNEAFSRSEKRNLKTTLRLAEGTGEDKRYGLASLTADRAFLLSNEELLNYFDDADPPTPGASPTDYAKCRGVFCKETDGTEFSWWWLSSPGNHSGDAVSVSVDKNLFFADGQFFSTYSLGGIRCSIRLSSAQIEKIKMQQK